MKINFSSLKKDTGIVYILYIDLEYKDSVYSITKIGVTSRSIESRVVEILTSIWQCTRVFPRCYVKRFRKVQDPYGLEAELLGMYERKLGDGLGLDITFNGSTECIFLDTGGRDKLIETYETLSTNDTYKQ